MFIKFYMTPNPVSITPDTLVPKVKKMFKENSFRHLPVVDSSGRVVGIVTDRDIRSAYPSIVASPQEIQSELDRLSETPVAEIMASNVMTLKEDSTLDEVFMLMEHQRVGAYPVVDDDMNLKGMFSLRDLMKACGELLGLKERGTLLIPFEDDGSKNILQKISTLFVNLDIPLHKLIRTVTIGHPIVYARVKNCDLDQVKKAAEEAGLKFAGPVLES